MKIIRLTVSVLACISFSLAGETVFSKILDSKVSRSQTSEDKLLELIRSLIPQNPIILEAGAHKAEDTLRFSSFWPEGTIYCFEPLPSNIEFIKIAIKDRPNIIFFPLALSNHNNEAIFYVNTVNSGAGTLYHPGHGNSSEYASKPIKVQCISPETWINKNNIERIDFMWLDMEGHELTVLKAFPKKTMKQVKAIFIETNAAQWWVGIPLASEIKKWMSQEGYKLAWISDWGRSANCLFVRN